MEFDPMTGKPVSEESNVRFDPMTGEKISAGAKKVNVPLIAGAVAVVAVAAVVIVNLVPRIVIGKNYKIVKAIQNMGEENHLIENLDIVSLVGNGNCTVTVSGTAEDVDVNTVLAAKKDFKTVSLEGQAGYDGYDLEYVLVADDEELYLQLPGIWDETVRYGYTDDKDDCTVAEYLDYAGVDINDVDEALQDFFGGDTDTSGDDMKAALKDASLKAIKMIEFEKTGKETFEIDGKERKCVGYATTVDEDLITDICDIYEEALADFPGDTYYDDLFDEIRDGAEYMDEIDVVVYLYKNRIAAVGMEMYGSDVEICFEGGNTPWENTTVLVDGDEVAELTGSVDGKVEELSLEADDETVFEYTYNFKTGELSMEMDEFELGGTVKKSGSTFTFALDELASYGYDMDVDLQIEVKKGAKIADIDKKNATDVTEITEGDIVDIVSELGW